MNDRPTSASALPAPAGSATAALGRWRRLLQRARRWSVVTVVAQTPATLTALFLFRDQSPPRDGLMFVPFVAGLFVVGGLVQFRRSVQHTTREGMTSAATSEIWLWGVLSAIPSVGPLAEVKLLTGAARAVERDTGAVDVLPRVRRLAIGRLVCAALSWPLMAYFFLGGSSPLMGVLVGGALGLPTLVCLALAMRTTTGALEDAAAVDVSALTATGARSPVAFATLPAAGADAVEPVPSMRATALSSSEPGLPSAARQVPKDEREDDT